MSLSIRVCEHREYIQRYQPKKTSKHQTVLKLNVAWLSVVMYLYSTMTNGTAIVTAAGMLNAIELPGKKLEECR